MVYQIVRQEAAVNPAYLAVAVMQRSVKRTEEPRASRNLHDEWKIEMRRRGRRVVVVDAG